MHLPCADPHVWAIPSWPPSDPHRHASARPQKRISFHSSVCLKKWSRSRQVSSVPVIPEPSEVCSSAGQTESKRPWFLPWTLPGISQLRLFFMCYSTPTCCASHKGNSARFQRRNPPSPPRRYGTGTERGEHLPQQAAAAGGKKRALAFLWPGWQFEWLLDYARNPTPPSETQATGKRDCVYVTLMLHRTREIGYAALTLYFE